MKNVIIKGVYVVSMHHWGRRELEVDGGGKVYLKAKMSAVKFNRHKGPMQLCNVGFKCQDRDVDSVRQVISGYDVNIF